MCEKHIKLTAQFVEDLFNFTLSEVGSNRRSAENVVLTFWRDFLLDCEG